MPTRITQANADYRLDHINSPLNWDQKARLRRQIEEGEVVVVSDSDLANPPSPAEEPESAPAEPEPPVAEEPAPDPEVAGEIVEFANGVPMTEKEARSDGDHSDEPETEDDEGVGPGVDDEEGPPA